MDFNSFNTFFDIVEILAGVYIIYQGINMKRTGTVTGSGLISKNINLAAAPDMKGFIKAMFPIYMVCGAMFIIGGIFTTWYDSKMEQNPTITLTVTFVLVAICIVLAFTTNRAQRKYLM